MNNVSAYCRFAMLNLITNFVSGCIKNIPFNMRPYLMRHYYGILLNNKCKAS